MTIESVESDSLQSNEIAFATSIEFSILCFLSISMLAHVGCNMMIGILVGFIVGYFAEARSKPDKALERARPKKPPDKCIQSKKSTRLIVIFGLAFVAILSSSSSFNSLILNNDIKLSNQYLWRVKAIESITSSDAKKKPFSKRMHATPLWTWLSH